MMTTNGRELTGSFADDLAVCRTKQDVRKLENKHCIEYLDDYIDEQLAVMHEACDSRAAVLPSVYVDQMTYAVVWCGDALVIFRDPDMAEEFKECLQGSAYDGPSLKVARIR